MNNVKVSRRPLLFISFVATLMITGCTDRISEANSKMAAIRNAPAQPVEPPPTPKLVEDYVYNASNVRSPFMPPSLLNRQEEMANTQGVVPDLNRTKEPLESFELSELVYRGLVVSPSGDQYGLVQRPDGLVDSVEVGNYMGMSDGRIVEITPNQINLIEIVPDNRAGFVEKPASIVSPL